MSDPNEQLPLIVGAGPVGLAAGVMLARKGIATRIIERRCEPSTLSKALAVNPRTLEILESTGVTHRMLEMGLPIRSASFHRGERRIMTISFDELPHKYRFMLGLSQASTEGVLAEAYVALGGTIERGVELVDCRNGTDRVEATLQYGDSSPSRQVRVPWLLGADGAHSTVRKSMNFAFPGSAFERDWHLADVPADCELEPDRVHGFFLDRGRVIAAIPVAVDQRNPPAGDPVWRIISNFAHPLQWLPKWKRIGTPVWESRFRIEHRVAESFGTERIFLAGDAAHIHSPVGARGMNLGIEDAWAFSALAARGEMYRYPGIRRPIDSAVVRRIEGVTRVIRGESPPARLIRRAAMFIVPRLSAVRGRALRAVTGLDHPLSLA